MLPRDWNHGGSAQIPGYGRPNLRDLLNGLHGLPGVSDLEALPEAERSDGMLVRVVGGGGSSWRWSEASELDADGFLVREADDEPAAGRWLRADGSLDVALAVSSATLNNAVLWTVPAGFELFVPGSAWEVTVSFTGGSSSAIGLSSSNAGLATAGDLLGGASGDVLATLVSTGAKYKGTKGTKVGLPGAVLVGGDTVLFNRVTSAFTAGSGFGHLFPTVLRAPLA